MASTDNFDSDNTQQSQLKLLIAKGKEQGYLTYAEVNDFLPPDIIEPEQIDEIIRQQREQREAGRATRLSAAGGEQRA